MSIQTFLFSALFHVGCPAGLRETLAHQRLDLQTCLAESGVRPCRLTQMHRCLAIFERLPQMNFFCSPIEANLTTRLGIPNMMRKPLYIYIEMVGPMASGPESGHPRQQRQSPHCTHMYTMQQLRKACGALARCTHCPPHLLSLLQQLAQLADQRRLPVGLLFKVVPCSRDRKLAS